MADERVNLLVDIDVKGDKSLATLSAKLLAFEKMVDRLESRSNRLSGAMDGISGAAGRASKSQKSFNQELGLFDRLANRLIKSARMIMFAVIGVGIEFAISALSIASVNAAFAIGKFAMQAYNYGMQALAGTVAALGVAAIGAAAAFREFQAAQYQFRYKDSAALGSALDQSSQGLRSLYKDTTLATFGVQALAGAFAAVSKQSAFTPASKNALKAMADFAQASGDPAQSLQSAATMIGILQKGKGFTQEALAAAKQISPEFDKAFKEGKYKNKDKFLEDLMSGKLASAAGVSGQADAVGRTLFGQFKNYLTQSLVEISDVGQRVLEPIKEAMHGVFQGLTRTFRRVSGDLVTFGKGPFLKSFVSFTGRLEDFTVVLFRKFLPATEGFWKKTTGFFTGFARYFREVRDALEPLRDGGSIIIETFGKPIIEIFRQIGKSVQALDKMAVENKDNFLAFGDALAKIVEGFFDISRAIRVAFNSALTILNPFLRILATAMRLLGSLTGMVGGSSIGGTALLGGLGMLAFKGRRSQRFRNRQGYQANAENKYIYGGKVSGSMGGPGAAAAAAFQAPASALTGAGSSLTGAAGALTAAAGAMRGGAAGSSLRGGMNGGYVDRATGQWIRTPNRKPGQSNADFRADTAAYKMANRGLDTRPIFERGFNATGAATRGQLSPREKLRALIYGDRRAGFDRKDSDATNIYNRARHNDPLLELRRMGRDEYREFDSARRGGGVPEGRRQMIGPAVPYDAMGQSRLTATQRMQSFARDQRGKIQPGAISGALRSNAQTIGQTAMYGVRGLLRGQEYASYKAQQSASGVSGAMRGGFSGGKGGLQKLVGTAILGKTYGTKGYEGFGATVRQQLGFAKAGAGGNAFTRILTGAKGGNFGQGYADARQRHSDLNAQSIKDGKGPLKKFSKLQGLKAGAANSFSGGGVVMGMAASALADKYGTDEAKGGMQVGASLMAINPLLGLAVGAGLTAMTAKTKLGGAVAGAVSGAAVGGMIAGPLGAAVGGLIGAGLGAFKAGRNQTKMVQDAMGRINNQQLATLAQTALTEIGTGKMDKTRKVLADSGSLAKRFEAAETPADMKKVLQPYIDAGMIGGNEISLATGAKKTDAVAKLKTLSDTMQKAVTPQLNQFDEIMKGLKQSTGMTAEAIFDLAMRKNVDLFDTTLDLASATEKLGVGMTKAAGAFRNALRDVQIGALDVFTQFKKTREMKDALQSSGENIRGGDNSTDAFLDYYTKSQDFANYTNPNSPLLNFVANAQRFGTAKGAGVGKGQLFTSGPLQGQTMGAEARSLVHQAQQNTIKGSASALSTQYGSMLSGAGVTFSDVDAGTKQMEAQINALITAAAGGDLTATEKVRRLESDATRGTALKGKSQKEIAAYFSGIFGPGIASSATKGGTSLFGQKLETETAGKIGVEITDEAILKMQAQFSAAIEDGFMATAPNWWNKDVPEWWQKGLTAEISADGKLVSLLPPHDTATPKAGQFGDTSTSKNLSRTLGRHSSFDSMLTGKRTITSSLRNHNLGSPSSDHATGNAYDLTGQNLGQYSSLIKSAGGFAEFHGAAGSRHLHVVPPPGPMGDTSTSMIASMTGGGGGSTYEGDTFNINVSGAADAQTTARAVAAEIMKMQKNARQRS